MFVIVVLFSSDKFLMVRHPHRGWEFPGGTVEPGETPEEAAKRECMEEAGIKIKITETLKKSPEMVVFKAIILDFEGDGEMEYSLFQTLPHFLSFPGAEAAEFLSLAGYPVNSSI